MLMLDIEWKFKYNVIKSYMMGLNGYEEYPEGGSSMSRILLVEDDAPLAMATSYALQAEGFDVVHSDCLESARRNVREEIALILLDVNLPDGDGYSFCKELRGQGVELPIIFLTALGEEVNVVQGLDVGADDYIAKPFRVRELISRIKANLRRTSTVKMQADTLTVGAFVVYLTKHEVLHNGESLNLTPSEYRLFVNLMEHRNQVLTRSLLLEQLWDIDGDFIDDNTLSVYIRRLREKLGDDKDCITTVRGVGYMFAG